MKYKLLQINEEQSWIKIEVKLPDGTNYVKRMMVNLLPFIPTEELETLSKNEYKETFGTLDGYTPLKPLTSLEIINQQVEGWYNQYIKDISTVKIDKTIKVGMEIRT